MYIINALQKLPVWETPSETGTPPATPQTTTGTPENQTTNDSQTAADDPATPAKDLLADDPAEPKDDGDAAADDAPKDLLADDDDSGEEATWDGSEVTSESLKEMFEGENEWDDEQLEPFLEAINKAESRADLAKQLVELNGTMQQAAADALVAQFNDTIKNWQIEAKEHKTLGGENLDATLAKVKTAINTYSENPKETMQLLRHTGASNSIHLIQLLHKMADAVPSEASPAEGTPAQTERSLAERMFGDDKPN